ncbi:MAG: alcohol dehydrogenase [Halobacteriovoraceae bacterium]|nr:alcohol dehydrogenase [Halobacteriovoraceae bacterium]
MNAIVTTGTGGYEKLVYKKVPVPKISSNEVLIKVFAAGVNNTEINTRLGWYSSEETKSTDEMQISQEEKNKNINDGGWNKKTPFPFIQGTDCCGEVIEVGSDKNSYLLGKRVLVRPCIRENGWNSLENIWMASDFNGAFCEYVKVPTSEVFPVESNWTSVELASIPCAYGTTENMVHRTKVNKDSVVLITGASGGIGSAAIQLCKRRGAKVIAVSSKSKKNAVESIGADTVLTRGESLISLLGKESVDVVIDNVAGEGFGELIEILKRGGRYASSGAVAGPIVSFDMRSFYLKDIKLIGCTAWDKPVFPNLIKYIENNEIKPLVWKTFDLENIVDAQKEFLKREHIGKIVLKI